MSNYIYYIDANMTDGGYSGGKLLLHSTEILDAGGLGAVQTKNLTLSARSAGAALQALPSSFLLVSGQLDSTSATTGPLYYFSNTESLRATQASFSIPYCGYASVCSYSGGKYVYIVGGEQGYTASTDIYRVQLNSSGVPQSKYRIGDFPAPLGGFNAPALSFIHDNKLWVIVSTNTGASVYRHGLTSTGTLDGNGWKQLASISGYYLFFKTDQGVTFSKDGAFLFIPAKDANGNVVILRGKLCGTEILEWWPLYPNGITDATNLSFAFLQDNTMYCLAQKGGTWGWYSGDVVTTGPINGELDLYNTGVTFNYYMDSPGGASSRVVSGQVLTENYRAITTTVPTPTLSGNQSKPYLYLPPQKLTPTGGLPYAIGYSTDDQGGVSLYASVDGGVFTANGFTGSYPNWSWSGPTMAEGYHTVLFRAMDSGGNFSDLSKTFLIDKTPPDLVITDYMYQVPYIRGKVSDYTSGISSVVWGSSTAGYPSTFSSYYPSLNSIPCNELEFILPTYYGTGEHYVSVIVADSVGNTQRYNAIKSDSNLASITTDPPALTPNEYILYVYSQHNYNYWNTPGYIFDASEAYPDEWLWSDSIGWFLLDADGNMFVWGFDGSAPYDNKLWEHSFYKFIASSNLVSNISRIWDSESSYYPECCAIDVVSSYTFEGSYIYSQPDSLTRFYIDVDMLVSLVNDRDGQFFQQWDYSFKRYLNDNYRIYPVVLYNGIFGYRSMGEIEYELTRDGGEYYMDAINVDLLVEDNDSYYVPSNLFNRYQPCRWIDPYGYLPYTAGPIGAVSGGIIIVPRNDPEFQSSLPPDFNDFHTPVTYSQTRLTYTPTSVSLLSTCRNFSSVDAQNLDNTGFYTYFYDIDQSYPDIYGGLTPYIAYPTLAGLATDYSPYHMGYGLATTKYPNHEPVNVVIRDNDNPLIYFGTGHAAVNLIPQAYPTDAHYHIGVNAHILTARDEHDYAPGDPIEYCMWITADGTQLDEQTITVDTTYSAPFTWAYLGDWGNRDELCSSDSYYGITFGINNFANLPMHTVMYEGYSRYATDFSVYIFNLRHQLEYGLPFQYPAFDHVYRYPNTTSNPTPPISHLNWSVVWVNSDPAPAIVISNVSATNITDTSATIIWTTDQAATSQVEYGTTTDYGSTTTLDTALLTSHYVTLSGLTPDTLYHYRVISSNVAGSAESSDYTFTTLAVSAPPPPPTGDGDLRDPTLYSTYEVT